MPESDYEIAELARRLANLIRKGKVEERQLAPPRVRVRMGELLTAWLPWFGNRAGADRDWSPPSVGEQVVVFSPDGDPAQGIVLPGLYTTEFAAPDDSGDTRGMELSDGARFFYNAETHELLIDMPAGGTVKVVGDTEASGEVADGLGKLSRLRTNYNGHKHIGNMGSPTSPPDLQDA